MDHKVKYKGLLVEAENAYNQWSVSQAPEDWEWFMHCEMQAADYAYKFEEEIFDECGDNSIPIE